MWRWLHHLFNPHCVECAHERLCKNCESYKEQVAVLLRENERLLNHIVKPEIINQPVYDEKAENKKPVNLNRHVPWEVRRQMLEENDRLTAEKLRKNQTSEVKSVQELEKELGIQNNEVANG